MRVDWIGGCGGRSMVVNHTPDRELIDMITASLVFSKEGIEIGGCIMLKVHLLPIAKVGQYRTVLAVQILFSTS